jgi:divalent metal cation (Fe/Co/Zn/Cd) transporter
MATKHKVGSAFFLGLVLIALTVYTSTVTGSTVTFSEVFHSFADTIGLAIYWKMLMSNDTSKSSNSQLAEWSERLLFVAGLLSFAFGISYGIDFLTGIIRPIKEPVSLLIGNSFAMTIIAVQLHLTRNVHHLFHAHTHENTNAVYFFGGGGLHLTRAHTVTTTELYADLWQSLVGVVVGLVALYGTNHFYVRQLDVIAAICLGAWMMWRARKIFIVD